MSDLGYDREDLVSGVREPLDKLESALERMASECDPNTDLAYFLEGARDRIRQAMDAARAALDEAVLEQRAIAAERLGIEQRRVALAKAALCRALKAMEGATVFVTSRERRKHPEGTDLWLENIEATRAAIDILAATQGIEAEGQDPQGLGAKHESPSSEGSAPSQPFEAYERGMQREVQASEWPTNPKAREAILCNVGLSPNRLREPAPECAADTAHHAGHRPSRGRLHGLARRLPT